MKQYIVLGFRYYANIHFLNLVKLPSSFRNNILRHRLIDGAKCIRFNKLTLRQGKRTESYYMTPVTKKQAGKNTIIYNLSS